MKEKSRAKNAQIEAYLQKHLLAFQIILVIMTSVVPLWLIAQYQGVRLPPFLDMIYWLWAGWYGSILMLRYWRWWKRAPMQMLMVILVPLNLFLIVGMFLLGVLFVIAVALTSGVVTAIKDLLLFLIVVIFLVIIPVLPLVALVKAIFAWLI